MSTVIKAENLGKKYLLSHQKKERYTALRDVMAESVKKWGKRVVNPFSIKGEPDFAQEEFWALKDVSFEIEQGDRVGVIGRNGAGKSTLLKILSRVTEPTTGRISLKGRVASLLEVGTGFHPELTGRENIFLNGAILGMSKAEIKKKFEEIVTFAEVEKFLDTPVKRYSSGMYVRLAFSVAAHLEPEILIVDEVLAVGDAQFQKKCLGKMQDVGKEGRTIILVSHNMTTVQALANKAIFLDRGYTEGISAVPEAVQKYLYGEKLQSTGYFKPGNNGSKKDAHILEAKISDESGEITSRIRTYDPIFIEIKWVNNSGVPVNPNFMLVNQQGVTVLLALDVPVDWSGEKKKEPGVYVSRARIPPNLLNANDYAVNIALDCSSPRICYEAHLDALRFTVWDPMDERCTARGPYTSARDDAVLWAALDWTWNRESSESSD